MKFNHLVEINDLTNPLIETMTRIQLWHGLILRAENPVPFVIGLEQCHLTQRSDQGVSRELTFGELVIRDRVTYESEHRVTFQTEAQPGLPAASLTMTIEEPTPDALFVRFEYDSGDDESAADIDAFYDEFRRSAYEEADIDTIKRIRELAADGRLDGPIN